ncbi:MAG: AAA family ATPase [Hyalangium sp.]|uniref:AAA family ATPase n=1 Tax=Hyalangium sp. TaxID=2028555 RepID=UPI00389AD9FF
MVESVTLQNFKSFGEKQTVPLESITVLVGPNNSGKSNFMSVGRFLTNSLVANVPEAIRQEGEFFFHRPPFESGPCVIGWTSPEGTYSTTLLQSGNLIDEERFEPTTGEAPFVRRGAVLRFTGTQGTTPTNPHSFVVSQLRSRDPRNAVPLALWKPFKSTRTVKLSLGALRGDSEVVPQPEIGLDGQGLAAVLGLWRGAMPEKAEALQRFLTRCLPEMENVFVRPAPVPGHQRLWFKQKDGLEIDSEHVSDGVLAFTALAMHALSVEPGQLLFIEEPEQSIHPKRLRELVDLLRDIVQERACQFVIATHSTVLLNAFQDQPEAILLFRRSETGTRVKRLSDVPELLEALQRTPPGDLLETGAFSASF